MGLTSLSFLLLFLPLSLIVYYAVPRWGRSAVLLAVSLLFYGLEEPRGLVFLFLTLLMDYGALFLMGQNPNSKRLWQFCFWFSVVKNCGIVFLMGSIDEAFSVGGLFGITVISLSSLDCVRSVYKGTIPPLKNPIHYILNCVFFPKLFAGPLQPCDSFMGQLDAPYWQADKIWSGFGKLVLGATKILLPGSYLYDLYRSIYMLDVQSTSVAATWVMLLAFALSIYYRLSGYCDMARGIGGLFGLSLPQNYYYPYQSRSISDFVERFNSTLWKYLQIFVYQELGEDKNGPLPDSLNLLVCGMLMGLWFGFRVNYLLWGAYIALFLVMERYLYPAVLARIPTLLRRGYSFVVIIIGFVLLAGDSLGACLQIGARLFGLGPVELFNNQTGFYFTSSWRLLLLSCFFATNICSLVGTALRQSSVKTWRVISCLVYFGLLLVVVSMNISVL